MRFSEIVEELLLTSSVLFFNWSMGFCLEGVKFVNSFTVLHILLRCFYFQLLNSN